MSKYCFLTLALLLLLLPINIVSGQVSVEKSTEKIVVTGNIFYVHTVRLGQTTYSIAKAYGTTVEAIVKENPTAASGIKEGEILRIPVSVTNAEVKTQPQTKTQYRESGPAGAQSGNYIYHEIVAGETVYSLSRKYNVTVESIEKSNPGISINDIPIGTKIAIPSTTVARETENKNVYQASTLSQPQSQLQAQPPAQQQSQPQTKSNEQRSYDGKFIYHRVTKGETLQSLSRNYNVSVKDIKKVNRGLLFPKEGEYVQIPVGRGVISGGPVEQTKDTVTETASPVQENNPSIIKEPLEPVYETTVLKNLRGSVRVAVLLPFFLRENAERAYTDSSRTDSKGQIIYKEVSQSGDWVYEPGIPFVEMYEGILLAADSLRNLGLDIKFDVYDIGTDTIALERLISSGKLRNADLMLGPVFSSCLEIVAKYAAANNIPVVSPVPLRNPDILTGNPTLFRMSSSTEVEQAVMAKQIASIPNANVVFLYSDSLMYDPRTLSFRNKLNSVLPYIEGNDSIKMHELFFSGRIRKEKGYIDEKALESTLVSGKENIIVLATTDSPIVSGAFSLLHNLSRRYDIRISGNSAIKEMETIDLRYFYDLRMMTPVDSYVDFSKPETNAFLKNYDDKFKSEPNGESFAWRGFDMAYYFIGGVAQYGRSFIRDYERFNPQLMSFSFRFKHADSEHGFENQNIYILQYNKDMTISISEANAY